jgi:hypothetical protein
LFIELKHIPCGHRHRHTAPTQQGRSGTAIAAGKLSWTGFGRGGAQGDSIFNHGNGPAESSIDFSTGSAGIFALHWSTIHCRNWEMICWFILPLARLLAPERTGLAGKPLHGRSSRQVKPSSANWRRRAPVDRPRHHRARAWQKKLMIL